MRNNLLGSGFYFFAVLVTMSFLIQGYGNIVEGQEIKGITGITKGSVDLTIPPDPFLGKACRYEVGWPIQVAPRKAALIVGRMISGTGNIDFIDGADLVLFDDLANINSDKAIPLTRDIMMPGDSTFIMKGYPIGGFVPYGAKQKDGSAHPYAGTGFGLSGNRVHEIDQSGHFDYAKILVAFY